MKLIMMIIIIIIMMIMIKHIMIGFMAAFRRPPRSSGGRAPPVRVPVQSHEYPHMYVYIYIYIYMCQCIYIYIYDILSLPLSMRRSPQEHGAGHRRRGGRGPGGHHGLPGDRTKSTTSKDEATHAIQMITHIYYTPWASRRGTTNKQITKQSHELISKQAAPGRAIRGNGISVNSTLPPS